MHVCVYVNTLLIFYARAFYDLTVTAYRCEYVSKCVDVITRTFHFRIQINDHDTNDIHTLQQLQQANVQWERLPLLHNTTYFLGGVFEYFLCKINLN